MRALVEVNDPHSLWPRATRERLSCVDPRMAAIVASIFEHDVTAGITTFSEDLCLAVQLFSYRVAGPIAWTTRRRLP